MMKSKLNINIVILIIVIAVYSFLCLSKHQYNRLTADSMLYFSIADKYLSGDLQNAINGYWGPLLAWLIMPFLFFGINDVLAINILNLMFGILSLLGVWILTVRFEIAGKIKGILLICMLPIVLQFSLVQPMDFLLVCILIFYVGIVFDVDYPKKINAGVFSGILGSLAYFTKAYAFPFFIVHFFLMNLLHYIRITAKVDAPGPDVVGGGLEFGVPVFKEGFFEPPNKTAFVIWEDPSYLRGEPWNAWQSLRHFKHFIKLMLKNVSDGLKIFESFSSLSVVILIAYILLLSGRSKNEILSHGVLLYPLFTIILFSGGYLLFHFEARYLWLTNILLLLMGGHVISDLFRKEFFRSDLRKNILIVVFTISFIFVPTKYFVQAGREGMDRDMYHISTDLNQYNIRGNLASNREHVPVHDAWHKTFRLAYWLDSRYYGQSREGISDDDLKIELEKFNIDYYFLWGNGDSVPRFLTKYQEVTKNIIPGLKVFSLKSTVVPSDLRQNQQ
jgi:hypothetical protein